MSAYPVAGGEQQSEGNECAGRQHREQESHVDAEHAHFRPAGPRSEETIGVVQQRASADELAGDAERQQRDGDAGRDPQASAECCAEACVARLQMLNDDQVRHDQRHEQRKRGS